MEKLKSEKREHKRMKLKKMKVSGRSVFHLKDILTKDKLKIVVDARRSGGSINKLLYLVNKK